MAIRFDPRLGRFLDDGMPAGVPLEYARPHVIRDQPMPMPLPMPEGGYDIPMPKEGVIDPGVDRYGRPRPMPLPVGGDGYGGGYGGGFGQKVPILKDDSLYDPGADPRMQMVAGSAGAGQPMASRGGVYKAVGDAMAAQPSLPPEAEAQILNQAQAEAQMLAQMQARGQGKAKQKFSVRSLFGLG